MIFAALYPPSSWTGMGGTPKWLLPWGEGKITKQTSSTAAPADGMGATSDLPVTPTNKKLSGAAQEESPAVWDHCSHARQIGGRDLVWLLAPPTYKSLSGDPAGWCYCSHSELDEGRHLVWLVRMPNYKPTVALNSTGTKSCPQHARWAIVAKRSEDKCGSDTTAENMQPMEETPWRTWFRETGDTVQQGTALLHKATTFKISRHSSPS